MAFQVEAPAVNTVARTDRRALSQVLINLANNAIKFTDKGEVRIVLDQCRDNGQVLTQFRVSDTGVGIRPEDQTRLFQAFTQLDSTSTRRFEGTGLGLYLSQKLAALIDGRLSFESRPGKGSEFTLTLRAEAEYVLDKNVHK